MFNLYSSVSNKTNRSITKSYSTSFSLAVSMLQPGIRTAIYNIYGFVRIADEIVDSFENCDQELLFNELEANLETALEQGTSSNPVLHGFVNAVHTFNIEKRHIDAFMKSMRADLYKSKYNSTHETDEYIYGSAKVVGLMCLKVFVNGDQNLYLKLEKSAMDLGSAFQKVNFLRDLKADFEDLDRTYFHDFDKTTFDETIKQKIIKDIELDFKNALIGIKQLPGRSQLAVWLAFTYYRKLLRKIQATPAQKIISTRIRVNNFVKFYLLNRALVKYKLRLI